MQPLVLEFTLTEQEYVALCMLPNKKRLRNAIVVNLGFAALMAANWLVGRREDAFLPILMGALFLYSGLTVHRNYRRLFRQVYAESPMAMQPKRVTLGEEGVRYEWHGGDATYFWLAITHYSETAELIVLYCGRWDPSAIPKRAFASREQYEQCLRLLADRIGRTTPEPVRAFPVQVAVPPESSSSASAAQPQERR
jgi:hypothetical protein